MFSTTTPRRAMIWLGVGLIVSLPLSVTPGAGDKASTAIAAADVPAAEVISGKPRERGLAYGRTFRDGIRRFLKQEIYQAFVQKPSPKDEMLRYAGACGKVVQEVCPIIFAELEGIAEGAGLETNEVVLITLHEELYHRGVLPKVPHCTAVAAGPPDTADGHTYVGQTWDWMQTVAGWSRIVEWRRDEGPSVLAYGFPGLPTGAGVNSAGIALTWTSANLGDKAVGARVGVPSYVLLTHLLYQKDLEGVIREAKRDKHAGWFTFVVGDGDGNLINIEGSPKGIAVEPAKGRLVRIGFGSREMTGTPAGKEVKLHARCEKMYDLLRGSAGKTTLRTMQGFFEDPKCGISVGKGTIDMMVFDTTAKTAHLSRGPSYKVAWREFKFGK
jgi:hypothetical protein